MKQFSLKINDQVEATCDEWKNVYYKGKITNVNSTGTYNITFDDGDRKYGVEKNKIKGFQLVPIEIAKANGHDAIVQLLTDYNKTEEKKEKKWQRKKKQSFGARRSSEFYVQQVYTYFELWLNPFV